MALDIGLDGNDAPEIQGNLPWDTWVGLQGRLQTRLGFQLMQPNYGIDVNQFIDTLGEELAIARSVELALVGLEDIGDIGVIQDGNIVRVTTGVTA